MGILKRVLKSVLSFVFIVALSLFIMANAFHIKTSEEFIMSEFKDMIGSNEGFSQQVSELQDSLREYFTLTGETEETVDVQRKTFTVTKEEADLAQADFKDVIIDKVLGDFYNTKLSEAGLGDSRALGSLREKSVSDINMIIYNGMWISVIVAVLSVIALFVLFTGRFVLVGINFLIVSISYYPMKWSIEKTKDQFASGISGQEIAMAGPFMTNVLDKIVSVAGTWYFYFFIAGVVCVGLGLFFKFMGWGLWFQSFFEKKKK